MRRNHTLRIGFARIGLLLGNHFLAQFHQHSRELRKGISGTLASGRVIISKIAIEHKVARLGTTFIHLLRMQGGPRRG